MTEPLYNSNYLINLDTFLDNYIHNIHKVDNRLNEYILDPNEKSIHDIRTSIRRLEAAYIVSPKKMRKKKIKEYVIKSKSLFKINSQIRDFDIILLKLTHEGHSSDQQIKSFEDLIKKNRGKKLSFALSVAHDLRLMTVPHLSKYTNHYNFELLQKKLIKRHAKLITNHASKIEKYISIVIIDSKKVKELHDLRKSVKKLRYILELNLSHATKNNEIKKDNLTDNQNVVTRIEKLKRMQDMLGSIHDYDITIAYLECFKNGTYDTRNITVQRKDIYNQFVKYYNSNLSSS